jgi:hypothetical protein
MKNRQQIHEKVKGVKNRMELKIETFDFEVNVEVSVDGDVGAF